MFRYKLEMFLDELFASYGRLIVIALAAAMLVVGCSAFAAGNNNGNNNGPQSSTTVTNKADANATAIGLGGGATVGDITTKGGNAEQRQSQDQQQGQGQLQGQQQSATNKGNRQSVTIVEEDRLQAPGLSLGAASPSANCAMTHGIGGSFPGGSIGLNDSSIDKGCERREWVRILGSGGAGVQALRIACMDPVVYEANPQDCDAVRQAPAPKPEPVRVQRPATPGRA